MLLYIMFTMFMGFLSMLFVVFFIGLVIWLIPIAALVYGGIVVVRASRRRDQADEERSATPARAPVRQFRAHLQRGIGQSNQRARDAGAVVGRPLQRILRLRPQGKILALRQRASALDVRRRTRPRQEGQEDAAALGERSKGFATTLRANARRLMPSTMLARKSDERKARTLREGRQEGLRDGLREGRLAERAEWDAWLERMAAAQAAGESFDEPPPSRRSGDMNGTAGRGADDEDLPA